MNEHPEQAYVYCTLFLDEAVYQIRTDAFSLGNRRAAADTNTAYTGDGTRTHTAKPSVFETDLSAIPCTPACSIY